MEKKGGCRDRYSWWGIRENVGVERVTVGARRPDGTRRRWRERERRELVDHDGDNKRRRPIPNSRPPPNSSNPCRTCQALLASSSQPPSSSESTEVSRTHPSNPHPSLALRFSSIYCTKTRQCSMLQCHDVVAKRYAYLSSRRVGANVCRI